MSSLEHLNTAFEKLACAENLDDLLRRAVMALQDPLGFDRAGILLYDSTRHQQVGTWGTDAQGQVRNERGFYAPVSADQIVHPEAERIRYCDNVMLQDLGAAVATGWQLQAAIFSGDSLLGWIYVDNLVSQLPIAADQCAMARTYANVLGQLVRRNQTEDTLIEGQMVSNRKMVLLAEQLAGLVPMSARSIGNLINFMALLSTDQFSGENQALLSSARKSADQLARIYRHFEERVHDATDSDCQNLPASVVQAYWQRQFTDLFGTSSHQLEVTADDAQAIIGLPLILFTQLVKELVTNALIHGLEACSAGRTLVRLKQTTKVLIVTVEDSGPGLDQDQYVEVLKLFVTSKPYEYLGSGLSVVQHYVERWFNGQLDLGPSQLGGLCCTLTIPIPIPVTAPVP
ncbi:MAG: ATP-binding protein [Reinekea forsetii]|jgi:signal transduction histidine kinase|uniref:histidine kinase n=1 Tax=Reinekea forsetii TaxID=1336806 RepID=A0A2K8KUE0_9GAMM|nr:MULTISPECIES: ATP-binding protein [Reinekea]ATX78232.1 ATPase-like protein, ATP-binding protein domain protein [Reinekea forsetii]MDO7673242.1 ATP-binding protein [Reinekea forsetii]